MKKDLSRRQFLHRTAGAAGALAASPTIFLELNTSLCHCNRPRERPPALRHHRHRHAGFRLAPRRHPASGVECVAACDLYDGRHTLAQEIVGKKIPTTRRYKDLLDNKEIDCLIAAVPIIGTSKWSSTPSTLEKISTAKSPCPIPPPMARPWSLPRINGPGRGNRFSTR